MKTQNLSIIYEFILLSVNVKLYSMVVIVLLTYLELHTQAFLFAIFLPQANNMALFYLF